MHHSTDQHIETLHSSFPAAFYNSPNVFILTVLPFEERVGKSWKTSKKLALFLALQLKGFLTSTPSLPFAYPSITSDVYIIKRSGNLTTFLNVMLFGVTCDYEQ